MQDSRSQTDEELRKNRHSKNSDLYQETKIYPWLPDVWINKQIKQKNRRGWDVVLEEKARIIVIRKEIKPRRILRESEQIE